MKKVKKLLNRNFNNILKCKNREKEKHINQRNTRAGNPKSQKVSLCFDQKTASKIRKQKKCFKRIRKNKKLKLNKQA